MGNSGASVPQHLRMGTAKMKDKETDKDGKQRGDNIEKSKADTK